jgi:D-3-phosphoglycerate dehydrogenase
MNFNKILLTSTSFQDTDGEHKSELNKLGLFIDYLRGPLNEKQLLEIIDKYDALICGDDEITASVLKKGKSNSLKVISKYGSGLDKIDLDVAEKMGIKVTNCPAINMFSVSEHVFCLLLAFSKNLCLTNYYLKNEIWKRPINIEIYGKNIGIIGLGNIGKEVAIRSKAFGLNVLAFDKHIDKEFCKSNKIKICHRLDNLFENSDIISIHLPLLPDTMNLINNNNICKLKNGVIIINTARSKIINKNALIEALSNGKIGGYLADVFDVEPIIFPEQLLKFENVLLTPHVASRTKENIIQQALASVYNLKKMINEYEYIQRENSINI